MNQIKVLEHRHLKEKFHWIVPNLCKYEASDVIHLGKNKTKKKNKKKKKKKKTFWKMSEAL